MINSFHASFKKVQGSRFKVKSKGRHELFIIYWWGTGPLRAALKRFVRIGGGPAPPQA
jgi:hypothetical protein